jgi:hypothetical protein
MGGHEAKALAAHWEQRHEAVFGREDVEVAVRKITSNQQVTECVVLIACVALKRKVEGGADKTMRTLCADQPRCCDPL